MKHPLQNSKNLMHLKLYGRKLVIRTFLTRQPEKVEVARAFFVDFLSQELKIELSPEKFQEVEYQKRLLQAFGALSRSNLSLLVNSFYDYLILVLIIGLNSDNGTAETYFDLLTPSKQLFWLD